MNFTDVFIRRPVLSCVVSLVIFMTGIVMFNQLTIRQYPKVDPATIVVHTSFDGADQAAIANFITTPIESALSGLNGVDTIYSHSRIGSSSIFINYKLGTDLNTAQANVMSKVSAATAFLPQNARAPTVSQMDPNAQPIMYFSLNGNGMPIAQLTDYYTRVILPQLQNLPGVGQASPLSGMRYAMRLWLDMNKLAALDLTPEDVFTALKTQNVQASAGRIRSDKMYIQMAFKNQMAKPSDFNHMVVARRGGKVVHLQDVGEAKLGTLDQTMSVTVDGKQSLVSSIIPISNANPLEVSQYVKQALKLITPQLPEGYSFQILYDQAKFILKSIHEVKFTLAETALAVVLVILLFLGSFRVLLVPALTIPLSLVGAFALMYWMGFTLNTLTLLALVLAIGMVVDDAIVVSENIHRHLEKGLSPEDAALKGAREIQFAVIAMTLTLGAVYAPIGLAGGFIGSMFKEFAFTLAGAVIISGIVALTLSPMVCSKVMTKACLEGRMPQLVDRIFSKLTRAYHGLLSKVLHHRILLSVVIVAIVGGSVFLSKGLQSEIVPNEDLGGVVVVSQNNPTANLASTNLESKKIYDVVKQVKESKFNLIFNGNSGESSSFVYMSLKDWDQRSKSSVEIANELRPRLAKVPSMRAFSMSFFRLPGVMGMFPIRAELKTTGSFLSMVHPMEDLLAKLKADPRLVNLDSSLKYNKPQYQIVINRQLAGDLGVSQKAIVDAVSTAIGSPQSNQFILNSHDYYVLPAVYKNEVKVADRIAHLRVRTHSGITVPLANLVSLEEHTVPNDFYHFQGLSAVRLTGLNVGGLGLGEALAEIDQAVRAVMPSDLSVDYSGMSRLFMQSQGGTNMLYLYALIFIFLILSAQFESFIKPFIVLMAVPMSISGALVALKLTGGTLNLYTNIGMVTLIGLISKHGILLVEFAAQGQESGMTRSAAILHAAETRLRPILITTAAMILGALPLALATGVGAHARNQLGWTIVGGMSFGTLLTLFVVPMVYTWVVREHQQPVKKPAAKKKAPAKAKKKT